ncbi:unnamed protein product [Cylicocyclus nassatus]|uniref:Uncharacterized protein n=1 Tax=Cylicocyclus nassatus TaxID=53992 RepID=A0AA36M216_CYLNA|nr:unnamed protein product [Cylicocyclus nassatus]
MPIKSVIPMPGLKGLYETVWAACRAVIFGCIVIAVGLAMTVLGYFDKQFSERVEVIDGTVNVYHDRVVQYQLKSMQYLGPILMGIGSFILIIACVVTLESRDKHAQVITEESMSFKRRRLILEANILTEFLSTNDLHSCSSQVTTDRDFKPNCCIFSS